MFEALGPFTAMCDIDCQSRESALESIASLYSVDVSDIEKFICSFDLDRHFEDLDPSNYGDRELRLVFEATFGCTAAQIDRVFWFHLTRVGVDVDFSEGILPLSEALSDIWGMMFRAFEGTEHEPRLRTLLERGVDDFHYRNKTTNPIHGGPYGMLVKDSAWRSIEIGNHDYLRLPEIVEDICRGYLRTFGVAIDEFLAQILTPTIVKFWSRVQINNSCIESTLHYIYVTGREEPMSINSNTCFDGNNRSIPREQIVWIERVEGVA